jgi:hypothetical protein
MMTASRCMVWGVLLVVLCFLAGCQGEVRHHVVSDKSLWSYGKPQSLQQQCVAACTQSWQDAKVQCVRLHENCSVKTVASGLKSYPKGYLAHKPESGSVVHYVADVTDPTTLRRTGVCAQRIQGCQREAQQVRYACEQSCG